MYDLLADVSWSRSELDTDRWLEEWVRVRYGALTGIQLDGAIEAWSLLHDVAYASGYPGPLGNVIIRRPTLAGNLVPEPWLLREAPLPAAVPFRWIRAWRLLVEAAPQGGSMYESMGRDLADVTFSLLGLVANVVQRRSAVAFRNGRLGEFLVQSEELMARIDDAEVLLASRPEYLLGRRVVDAIRHGKTARERSYLRSQVLRLVTVWSEPGGELVDYARRGWSGLVGSFYRPRWQIWRDHLTGCLARERAFDPTGLDRELRDFERGFVEDADGFPSEPRGNTYDIVRELAPRLTRILEETVDLGDGAGIDRSRD